MTLQARKPPAAHMQTFWEELLGTGLRNCAHGLSDLTPLRRIFLPGHHHNPLMDYEISLAA